ncbi:MAG: type IV pilus modification PilV family protein [Gemmatimonadaceae bacterium]
MSFVNREERAGNAATGCRLPAGVSRGRDGFTLVELIVAIVILSIGVLGLASTAAVVTRQMSGGAQQTLAANVAQSRFERLRSVNCSQLAIPSTGSATGRGMSETWTLAAGASRNPSITAVVLTDTVKYYLRGQVKTRAFRSVRTCP